MDKYRIDSHKLMFHPKRVVEWKAGRHIYPIYVEISPSGVCNHRCSFCALDFMEYKPHFLDTDITEKAIADMAALGIKSIMFGGEGEPLIHKDIAFLTRRARLYGIDVGITTNGSLLDESSVGDLILNSKWIKVSLNAGTKEEYKKIHNVDQYDMVWQNIKQTVKVKKYADSYGSKTATIGVQAVLLPENVDNIDNLIIEARDAGIDYVVLKPYSQMSQSKNKYDIDNEAMMLEVEHLNKYSTNKFKVIVRMNALQKANTIRPYNVCYALPFWSYISSDGNVWACSAHLNEDAFLLGNIYKHDLRDIWNGRRIDIDIANCRVNCRMDECNRYLHELIYGEHNNFI